MDGATLSAEQRRAASEAQLLKAGGLLLGRILAIETSIETLRALLVEGGVFTEAEFAAKFVEVDARLVRDRAVRLGAARDEMQLRLLQQRPPGRA